MSKVGALLNLFVVLLIGNSHIVSSALVPERQLPNCQNCYAVAAYELIRYKKPDLKVSVKQLMQETKQGCSGGNAKKILDKYFSKTKVERGGLYKVINLLKTYRPLIIDLSPDHLVTAWKASENGILIWDPRDGTKKIISRKNHNLVFKYLLHASL
jgi:ABC-type bacteriocin/lantibiotic exporter with double-glycine peptidase domain